MDPDLPERALPVRREGIRILVQATRAFDHAIQSDSVRPILEVNLADLVEMDQKITSDVYLEPTPGHTPGHVSIRISSKGELIAI